MDKVNLANSNTGVKQRKDSTTDGINKDLAYNYYFGMNNSDRVEGINTNIKNSNKNEDLEDSIIKSNNNKKEQKIESVNNNNNNNNKNNFYDPNNNNQQGRSNYNDNEILQGKNNYNINYNINYNNNFNLPQTYYNKQMQNKEGNNFSEFNSRQQNYYKPMVNPTARFFVIKSVDEDNIHKVNKKFKIVN